MKVIFLQDVPNVAKAGQIKEVASGYGKNFLIPRKLAVMADAESMNAVAAKIEANARSQAQTEADMVELAGKLEGQEIILEAQSGGKERLYGSITTSDIAEELEKSTGLTVDRRKIEIDESIRKIGSYEVSIRLAKDIVPKITVTVMAKGSEEE